MAVRFRDLIVAALISIAVPVFAQDPPSDFPIPPFTTWDPTNALGTLNDWVVNKLNPNLTENISGATTTYPTHAILLASATVPIGGPATLSQQGFYASGDGGATNYDWNPTSYCPGGTSGSPVAADYVACILPPGQSASIAGRYLLRVANGTLDVRQVGMQPVTPTSAPDNYPLIPALNAALGNSTAGTGGYRVIIPGVIGQSITQYYFSQPWTQSVPAKYECVQPLDGSIYLYFGAGYDGVIVTAESAFNGCRIYNMGFGQAYINPLSTTVYGNGTSGGPAMYFSLPGVSSAWGVGDGIIASGRSAFYPVSSWPPIIPGTTISSINGDGSLVLSQLPNQFFGASAATWSTVPLRSTAVFTGSGTNFIANDTINVAGVTYTFIATLGAISHQVKLGPNFQISAQNLVSAVMNTTGQFITYIPDLGATSSRYLLPNGNVTATFDGVSNITFTSKTGGPGVNTYVSVYTAAGTSAGSFGGATFSGAEDSGSCALPCLQLNSFIWLLRLPAANAFQVSASTGQYVMAWKQPALPAVQLYNGDKTWSGVFPWGSTVSQLRSGSIFQETSTNNFQNGDTIQVGNDTWTFVTSIGSTPGNVLIGANFAASSANLSAGMAHGAGSGTLYVAQSVASNVSLLGAVNPTWLTFYSTAAQSPTTNAYLSVYTPAGTPAGTMLAANFGTYTAVPVWQPGAGNQLATATAAPGSEVPLWIMPADYKRTVTSTTRDVTFDYSAIGELMNCSSGFGMNCDLSRDENSFHQLDFFGRWAEGDNYATSSTKDEQFSDSFGADDLELGTLGEDLYNPNYESTESSTSNYGILMYCASQNATTIVGGYIGGGNMCSNTTTVIPGQPIGGPGAVGLNSGAVNGGNNIPGTVVGGGGGGTLFISNNNQSPHEEVVTIGGVPATNQVAISWDTQIANSSTESYLGYNAQNAEWVIATGVGVPSYRMIFPISLSNDYGGSVNNSGVNFPLGIVLGNGEGGALANTHARAFGACNTIPTGTFHLQGDTCVDAVAGQGGSALWYSAYGSFAAVVEASGTALTVMQTFNPPSPSSPLPVIPTISAGGSGYASSVNLTGTMTGTYAGCTTEPVLNVTASGATGAIITVNSITTPPVCAAVPSSAPWTPGGALLAGTGATFNLTWAPDVTAGAIVIGQTLGTPYAAGTTIVSGSGASWVTSASATISSPTSVTGSSWRMAAPISNDVNGYVWSLENPTVIANLPACAAAYVGSGIVTNGVTFGTSGYGVVVSTTGSATRKVFCDGTNWYYD